MRIGIDVRYLSHGLVGGVHNYVAHFVPELIDLAQGHQIFLYADTKRPFELTDLPDHVIVRYLPYLNPLSSVANDFFMRRQMARDNLNIVHFPANYGFSPSGVRTVITLHDALNILPMRTILHGLSDGYARRTPRVVGMMTYLHFCTKAALQGADLILTDSKFAGEEIARYSGFDPRKIVAIPLAPSSDLRRIESSDTLNDVRRRLQLPERFILADALKNPTALVEAWRLIPSDLRQGRQIVFFSRRPDPLPIILDAVNSGDARLLVRPSREDLVALYGLADAFVFPSWTEGFGIPVLEAMACGAPVVASNRGSIPEVAGDAALLADAADSASLSQQIARVLGCADVSRELREKGFARAADFSWRRSAQRILQSYEAAVAAK